jgi:hypothetical protein
MGFELLRVGVAVVDGRRSLGRQMLGRQMLSRAGVAKERRVTAMILIFSSLTHPLSLTILGGSPPAIN